MAPRVKYVRKNAFQSGGMFIPSKNRKSSIQDRMMIQDMMAQRKGHGRQFSRRLTGSNQSGGFLGNIPLIGPILKQIGLGKGQIGGYGGGTDPNQEGGFLNPMSVISGLVKLSSPFRKMKQKGGYGGGTDPNQEGGIFPLMAPGISMALPLLKQIGLGKGQRGRSYSLTSPGIGPAISSYPGFKGVSSYPFFPRKRRRKRVQKGGILPLAAAALPALALVGKTVGLGALAGLSGFGATEAVKAMAK